jgi:hypothetical protein
VKPVAPFLFVLFGEVVKAQDPFESFAAVISRPLLERHEVWLQTLVVAKRSVQMSQHIFGLISKYLENFVSELSESEYITPIGISGI